MLLSLASPSEASDFEAHIQNYVKEHQFQGAVMVAQHGEILFQQAYGFADKEAKVANTVNHQFLIGSLTKSFTAVAIMRLVEQKKLDLHAPITQYIPDLAPAVSSGLTLHILLKHQSGLPSHLERLVDLSNPNITSTEILEIINGTQQRFEPGTQYQYGNLNYHLAAMVIENVMGLDYPQAMRKLIFSPLNMENTGVERQGSKPKYRVKGYRKTTFGVQQDENLMAYALGSGDMYSTLADLWKWEQALYRNDFLSPKSLELLFSPESEAFGQYGYGFRIQPYQRGESEQEYGVLTRHGGSMNGFLANLHRYVDDRLTVIVLGNIRAFPIRDLTFELKEIALEIPIGKRSRRPVE